MNNDISMYYILHSQQFLTYKSLCMNFKQIIRKGLIQCVHTIHTNEDKEANYTLLCCSYSNIHVQDAYNKRQSRRSMTYYNVEIVSSALRLYMQHQY